MNNLMMALSRNRPSIMTGLGIGCFITAIIAAVEYSPMAYKAIEEKKEELDVEELSAKEVIMTVGAYVIPIASFAIAGGALIICANNEHLERQAAAVTACALYETSSEIYRNKTREIIGERKERDISENVAKEKYYRDMKNGTVIISTSNADGFMMYDSLTKQKIRSKIEIVKDTINDLNRRMLSDGTITLDEYCLAMNEEPMEFGTELGWNIDRGYIKIKNPTAIVSETGEPIIVIEHEVIPRNIH